MVANQNAEKLAGVASKEAAEASRQKKLAEDAARDTQKALTQVESSLTKAEKAEQVSRAAEEEGRKLLYTTDMRLAPFVWGDDRSTAQKLRTLLAKHNPSGRMKDEGGRMNQTGHEPGSSGPSSLILHPSSLDLRGFEWHYYQHLLDGSAAVFSGHEVSVIAGAFTSDGQLVTLDQNGQARRWNLGSQDEDKASRRELAGGRGASVRVLSPDGRLAALAEGNKVHVFGTSTGKEQCQIDSAAGPARLLIFTPDGGRLVIVDDKIRWCNAASGEVIASVAQKFERSSSLTLSADGLTLAVVGHSPTGSLFSIFRLDASAKKVAPLAKEGGVGGTLGAAALAPDGRLIAVGAKLSGSVSVCDTGTGRPIAQDGSAHASPISAMTFYGDGFKLVTADVEGTIKIWEDVRKLTSKSAAAITLKGHEAAINHVGFSPTGKQLVTTSADNTARVWDLDHSGAAIRALEPSGTGSSVARFSADGQLIAAAAGDSVRLWDAGTGKLVRELSAGEKERVCSVAFSPTDKRLLAVGCGGGGDVSHVVLWDIDAGNELARLPGATDLPGFPLNEHNGPVGALAFSTDGKYLAAGFGSKNMLMSMTSPTPLKVWEVATRRLIRRLSGHTNYCMSLDFSRDGKLLASGSRDGTAIIWSTETWRATQTLRNADKDSVFSQFQSGRPGMTEDVAFSPDGKTLAMASREGTVQLWDVAGGKLLATLKGHSSTVNAVVFSPDGRTLASGSGDQTVRLWNVETRRELLQLDSGGIELGQVQTLAFSPDGQHLLAGGSGTAFWSSAPIVWNDPDRASEKLRLMLQSNALFQSRIRMLSENLGLHRALEKLDAKDVRVRAALAAALANWHASRHAWPEAAHAFDRLVAADARAPEAWLRTRGLLRLATALLHQNRPRDAAALLTGGAKRRAEDGAAAAVLQVGLGFAYSADDGKVQVTELLRGYTGSRAGLRPGDVIVKVNDTELTRESLDQLAQLLAGGAGTKVRLSVRHSGSEQPQVIELTREQFVYDAATADVLHPLRGAINERLAREPRNPGLLELRAELAGQWSDTKARLADYTAAIEALLPLESGTTAVDLKRLYGRRGNAHVALKQWQQAVDDYARVVTDATTDDELLANQALALAEVLHPSQRWTMLKPVEAKSELGATLSILPDDSILVSGASLPNDRYRVVLTVVSDIDVRAVRLEALTHESLPGNGPGRCSYPIGTFAQDSWTVTARPPDGSKPIKLDFDDAWADHENSGWPIKLNGHWNIFGSQGGNCTAIWSTSKAVSLTKGWTLALEMQCHSHNNAENLGHFRLSVSSDPAVLDRARKSIAVTEFTSPAQKLVAAYQFRGDGPAALQLVERRPKLAGLIGDLFVQDKDKDWSRAVEIYSRGITAETTDAVLLGKRARAYEALRNWDAAAADWSRAATGNPDGAHLLGEFARRLAGANRVCAGQGTVRPS